MYHLSKLQKGLTCDMCREQIESAYEDRPLDEFAQHWQDHEANKCPECYVKREWSERLERVNRIIALQDAGCPVGRYEITDSDWLLVGEIKHKRAELMRLDYGN